MDGNDYGDADDDDDGAHDGYDADMDKYVHGLDEDAAHAGADDESGDDGSCDGGGGHGEVTMSP